MIDNLVNKHLLDFKNYTVPDNNYKYVLNANESPYNIFNYINDSILEGIKSFKPNLYPDPMSKGLRARLAKYNKVSKENIICGNGSDELISMIFTTFVQSNDVVVSHVPTFDMYSIGTKIAKGNFIPVKPSNDYKVDTEEIIKTTNDNNAKLLFLCVPNNPTGYAIPKDEILSILDNTSCIVVIDEAYMDFYGISCLDLIDKYENIIILKTLSKALGMAGLRVGYAIGNENIINWLYKIKQPYNLNSMSQLLGEILLDNIDLVKEFTKKIIDERIRLYNKLLSFKNIKVYESSANFILIKYENGSKKLYDYLLNKDILVKYYNQHAYLSDCFRITVGDTQTNDYLVKIIGGYLNEN